MLKQCYKARLCAKPLKWSKIYGVKSAKLGKSTNICDEKKYF